MPRQYLTPTEFLEGAYGYMLSDQLASLPTGQLDRISFRASQRIDDKCKKRIGAPLTTTLAVAGHIGDTSVSVASTLGYDNKAEQAIVLEQGTGLQETIQIQQGGVVVTSYAYPYPGIISLVFPLTYGHTQGALVAGCYQEVTEAGSSSSGDPYAESLESQAAQLALAHLPVKSAGLTRVVFVKHYPIITIKAIEHSYSFDVNYNLLSTGAIINNPAGGYYRFMVGSVILPEGFMRTTYTAGYQNIPDGLKRATELLMAEELAAFANPYGATEVKLGQRDLKFSSGALGSMFSQQADAECKAYRRTV